MSAMARYWSAVYLLSALAFLLLLRAYETERPRDYRLALIPLVLGSLTHPTFLFPVAGVVLGLAWVRRDGAWGLRLPSRAAWLNLWIPLGLVLVAGAAALLLVDRAGAVQNWGGRGPAALLRLVPAVVQWFTPTAFAAGVLGGLTLLFTGREAGRWRQRAWGAGGGAIRPSGRRS